MNDPNKLVEIITDSLEALTLLWVDPNVDPVREDGKLCQQLSISFSCLDLHLRDGGHLPDVWAEAVSVTMRGKYETLTREHAELVKERDELRDHEKELLDQVQCLQWDLEALQAQHDQCPEPSTTRRR